MEQKFLFMMTELAYQAGKIALKYAGDSNPTLKDDDSVLTAADKEVSALAHEKLSSLLMSKDHILIEEEDPDKDQYFDNNLLQNTPYIWAVDPIDGTRLYANNIPLYGVSIGLIKELKPYLGVVYFPALGELFYCDGGDAFYVKNAFSTKESKSQIIPIETKISSKSLFLLSDTFFKEHNWEYENCRLFVSACATVNMCWPVIGRACGCLDQSYLWDLAGSWPIFQKAGLHLRALSDGKVMNKLDTCFFAGDDDPWKLKEYNLLSSERNFSQLKKNVVFGR